LQFINDLSLRIDLEKTLKFAEGLFIQLSTFKNLPAPICAILGLPILSTNLETLQNELGLVEESLSKSNCSINETKKN
jgi:hypothetical protein